MPKLSDQDFRDITAAGPELSEFVSDYVAIFDETGEVRPGRQALIDEIASAWAEQAVATHASKDVYEQVVAYVKPQLDYYV